MSRREYYCYLVICVQIVYTKTGVIQMDPNSLNAVIKKIHSLYKDWCSPDGSKYFKSY